MTKFYVLVEEWHPKVTYVEVDASNKTEAGKMVVKALRHGINDGGVDMASSTSEGDSTRNTKVGKVIEVGTYDQ